MLAPFVTPLRILLLLVFAGLIVVTLTLSTHPASIGVSFNLHTIFRNPAFFSYAAGQPSCPSVDIEREAIDHNQQTCSAVPSADSAFELELCHEARKCNSFTLRVARTDRNLCSYLENTERKLSQDLELDAWIKHSVGPDVFEIRTDGAERVAGQEAAYEGDCRWRFDVQLRDAGPVWLTAWHTYQVRLPHLPVCKLSNSLLHLVL